MWKKTVVTFHDDSVSIQLEKKQSLERMLTYTTKTLKPYLNLVDEAASTQDTYFSSKIFIVPTSENPLRFGKIAFLWVIVNEQGPLKYNKL